jgi:hypothetical protein
MKTVKVGGQLQQVSDEELTGLSAKMGRTQPPTQPLEAGVIGGSPDQAKMAGTPAQSTNALRIGIQGEERLQDRMRRGQVRRDATAQEQAQMERGGRVGRLAGLEERVEQQTRQMVSDVAAQEAQTEAAIRETIEGLPEDQQQGAQDAIAAFRDNPTDPQVALALNQALGRTQVGQQLATEELSNLFLTPEEQVAKGTGDAFQDNVSVSDLDVSQLGYTDVSELGDLLGISPEELAGMNVRQLIEETQAQIEEEHTRSEDLRAAAANPNLGPAERAEARKQLREMGAVGIKAAETEMDQLAQDIEDDNTVTFAGEEMTISDMLDDEYLSGLAAKYVTAAEDDEFREQLAESEPELAEWLDKNKESLAGAVGELETGVTEFADLQFRNQEIANPVVGEKLDDDIMGAIFDDWGALKGEEYNLKETPVLDILNDEDYDRKHHQAQAYEALKTMSEYDDALVKEMSTLSEKELRQSGALGTKRGPDKQWKNYTDYLEQHQDMMQMDPRDKEDVAYAISGRDWGATKNISKQTSMMDRSGLFGDSPQGLKNVAAYEDLKSGKAAKTLKNQMGKQRGIRKAMKKGQPNIRQDFDRAADWNKSAMGEAGISKKTWDVVSGAFNRPGDTSVSGPEGRKIAQALEMDDLEHIYNKRGFRDKLKWAANSQFVDRAEEHYRDNINEIVSGIGGGTIQELINGMTVRKDEGTMVERDDLSDEGLTRVRRAIKVLKRAEQTSGKRLKSAAIARAVQKMEQKRQQLLDAIESAKRHSEEAKQAGEEEGPADTGQYAI